MKKIFVLGSVNVDHTTFLDTIPVGGQTISGLSYQSVIGGKGANQAVACALSGGDVKFLCSIGDDSDGLKVQEELKKYPLKVTYSPSNYSTGIATILVEASSGQNRIIVVSGANSDLTADIVLKNEALIEECDYLLLQLEIPLDSIILATKIAKKYNKTVILNPAPAIKLPKKLLEMVDYLTPNETELSILSGIDTETKEGCLEAAKYLISLGVKNLIITRGSSGSIFVNKEMIEEIKAYKVNAVDTTAAGDCYNGVFLSYLSRGYSVVDALNMASKASAIAVTKKGAITSLPNKEEIETISI